MAAVIQDRIDQTRMIENRIARLDIAQQIHQRNLVALRPRQRAHDEVEIGCGKPRPTIRSDHRDCIMRDQRAYGKPDCDCLYALPKQASCLEVSSARQAGRLIIFRVHEVLFRWFKCSCRSPSGSAIHRDERTDNFARLKMASSIWLSLDYTSQFRGVDWTSGPLRPTKPSPLCRKTIRWRGKRRSR